MLSIQHAITGLAISIIAIVGLWSVWRLGRPSSVLQKVEETECDETNEPIPVETIKVVKKTFLECNANDLLKCTSVV